MNNSNYRIFQQNKKLTFLYFFIRFAASKYSNTPYFFIILDIIRKFIPLGCFSGLIFLILTPVT